MAEETKTEIRVHCSECGHPWVVAYLPMELSRAAFLMQHAYCPRGHDAPVMWGDTKAAT
jgi:hypothetical protein